MTNNETLWISGLKPDVFFDESTSFEQVVAFHKIVVVDTHN